MTTSTLPRWKKDSELSIVLDIAKNIVKHNKYFNITILSPHCKGAKMNEEIEGVKIYRFKYMFPSIEKLCYEGGMISNIKKNKLNFLIVPFFFIFQLLSIKKIVAKEKIDIIHSHWLIPQGLISVVYKKIFNRKIKIICSAHGSDILNFKSWLMIKIKKFIILNCSLLTAVSNEIAKEINKICNKKRIVVINNGININHFKNKKINIELLKKFNIENYCLLFVGRLIKIKGIVYLIKAMPKILKKFPKIKLLIIGNGPQYLWVEQYIKKNNLYNSIYLLGKIPNYYLPQYYNLADIFIGPSLMEGFGMTFAEAISCETLVLTTNIEAIKETLNNFCFIVLKKNSDEISKNVIQILSNLNSYDKIKTAGRKYAEKKFNWELISKKYINEYELLNKYDI